MARKMLILDDPFLQNRIEVESGLVGGHWAAAENNVVAEKVRVTLAERVVDFGKVAEEGVIVGGSEDEDVVGEEEARAAAIEELLKEESYKTPTKGQSNVAISVEIEEFANVEVSLPPPSVGMVFDSWQKIDEYFRNYGKQEGFGVVRSSGATIRKGENAKDKRNVTWTCECYGLPGRKRKKTGCTFVSDSHILVMQALQLLELQVDEKIAVVIKKGLVGTPSSVAMEKGNDSKPSTQRQGSCDPQNVVEEDPPIIPKDPPLPKRPAHRTTDSRYKSCLEKPRKTAKKSEAKKKTDSQAGFTTPSSSTMPQHHAHYQYSPHSAGGIQIVDMDGSIGYFTSVGGGVHQFHGSQISSQQGGYLPYSHFPIANVPYPIPVRGWRSPVSPASAASRQGGFVPIFPRTRPPATPPPTPTASRRS
uniref:FAR1 domain-containing protein n=1 Tax=Chenopodium quinoa TaxID=63459 RepID=A0A803N8U4_CHEQI